MLGHVRPRKRLTSHGDQGHSEPVTLKSLDAAAAALAEESAGHGKPVTLLPCDLDQVIQHLSGGLSFPTCEPD